MPITPWAADSYTHVSTAPVVEPIWTVQIHRYLRRTTSGSLLDLMPPTSMSTVPAWDIEVSFDGGRSPYGIATFKAPLAYIGADVVPAPGSDWAPIKALSAYAAAPILIHAGYHRAGGDDLRPLFTGFISKRVLRRSADGEAYLEFTAQTADALFDWPTPRSGNVGNTWTSIKGGMDSINADTRSWPTGGPWYRLVNVIEEAGYMNTPTSAQLSSWRAMTYQKSDNAGDTLRTWAATLGQWLRGDPRGNPDVSGAPQLLISADPYPYRSALTVTPDLFSTLERVEDVDAWANILNFTATWTDPSTGDAKNKTGRYLSPSVGTATSITGQIRARDITVQNYPPSGALPASYPLATSWLRRVGQLQEARYTGTSRAMFWLQPRIDGINLTNNLGDGPGPIDSITFQVDKGTQTMTWTADNSLISA